MRTITVGDSAAATDLTIAVPVINGGLTKAGPGTLALTGANTYAGDTSVEAGTLRLASASLADAADVILNPAGKLDLAFAGNDTIDALRLDNLSLPAGTWGGVGSGAQHTTALITGTGLLDVTTFTASADFNGDGFVDAADLAQWQLGFGTDISALNFSEAHALGDADLDGDVDGADFLSVQQQFGAAPPLAPVTAAVPEPAAAMLMCLAASAFRRRTQVSA
jgi:autotransporter-associated beta strand protein